MPDSAAIGTVLVLVNLSYYGGPGSTATLASAPVASSGSASLASAPVASGGTVGPQSNAPTDTGAYVVVNYIIKY